jgi:hypothetical protein
VNLTRAIYAVEVAAPLFGLLLLSGRVPQAALWTGEMDGYLGAVAHPWNMRPDSALFQCRTLPQSN